MFKMSKTPDKVICCCCSVTQSCLTLCDPVECSTWGLPVPHHLPEFMFIALMMLSSHFILWCPLFLLSSIFPSIRDFSNELSVHIRGQKYWSFSISLSSEYLGLISLKIDWFDPAAVQGTFRSLLQHHSSKTSILWGSAFFMVQFSQLYVTMEKTISLKIWTFVGRVMSLLFNTLSKFVITFMPRNNCFLISWLQSPYTKGIEKSTKISVVFQKVWMSWTYLFRSIYGVSTIF